jgi:hypothetical protein
MPYYPPSSCAVAAPARPPTGPATLVCRCCGDTMKHSRTILKFGVRAERLIFVCPSCKAVDSKELKLVA